MTAELTITGREHWTQKGSSTLFLWENAFFSQPAPIYRGA